MGDSKETVATATIEFESGALFGAVTGVALHLAPDLELAPAEGEDEVALAIRLLGDLKLRAEKVTAELVDATEEIVKLNRSIAGHKGLTTRERRKAEALEAQLPPKPRRFAAIEKPLSAAQLLELIGDAEAVQVAFLDPGGVELAGVAPREIAGDAAAWKLRGTRLFLEVPSLVLHGPEPTAKRARVLGGYALMIDGDAAALAKRDPLPIGVGAQVQLKGDVVFG